MSDLESIKEDMTGIVKDILEKQLACRTFTEDKVKTWGDEIMEKIYQQLKEIYPQYGYGMLFYMSDISAYVSNAKKVCYQSTDITLLVSHQTVNIYSEIRLIAYLKRGTIPNFSSYILNYRDLFLNVNNKLFDNLSGRTFDYDKFPDIILDVLNDVYKMFTSLENNPCFYLPGYINEQPEITCFHHKFFDLEYLPVTFEFSNNSFICRLFLFLINNN